MTDDARQLIDDLFTVRDWLRYAVTAFTRAGLVFGHGTGTATDEAAFLILTALALPIEDINPWLDSRLARDEREAILALISKRITTRKPAAYLTNTAYIQRHKFYVDERVIVPRSFIGELLARDGLAALSDISADALDVAARNVADYGLQDRVRLFRSDLFETLPDGAYDLIIANPPYVAAGEVAAFAPEYRAEPQLAHLGGTDGLDIVRRILDGARERLSRHGQLIVEIGTGQDRLEAARPDLAFLWLDSETSSGEVFALSADDLKPKRGGSGRRDRKG